MKKAEMINKYLKFRMNKKWAQNHIVKVGSNHHSTELEVPNIRNFMMKNFHLAQNQKLKQLLLEQIMIILLQTYWWNSWKYLSHAFFVQLFFLFSILYAWWLLDIWVKLCLLLVLEWEILFKIVSLLTLFKEWTQQWKPSLVKQLESKIIDYQDIIITQED